MHLPLVIALFALVTMTFGHMTEVDPKRAHQHGKSRYMQVDEDASPMEFLHSVAIRMQKIRTPLREKICQWSKENEVGQKFRAARNAMREAIMAVVEKLENYVQTK
ncbi:hypothetical protein CRM22_009960 [Opisthorchis felineus]|uniref:SXP/RAL-2 family protein Ani s 5-like cation-binding domain-containing protein n=1 Tax=Opisthorchis felineus TaxID=147828 RepID=A0A4S2L3E5_OPIFE|nr:hypothetical protein CRM22_009960 [Opisthorchis felineus]